MRRFRHSALFVSLTLATLAISLGASTAMFTVVHAFLLSALPYERAERLALIWSGATEGSKGEIGERIPLSPGVYSDLRAGSRGFEQVAAFFAEGVNVRESAGVERVQALFVSGDFFPLLRRGAKLGRALRSDDARAEAPPVVALSERYWRRRFGADPQAVGRTLEFGGRVFTIVGVLGSGFRFSESLGSADGRLSKPIDLWVPLDLGDQAHERGFHYLTTVARLRPGHSLEAARREVEAYARSAARQYPDTDLPFGLRLVALREQIFGPLRPALLTLWAATGFLVLLACANVLTLLIARAQGRDRDVAVRLALGATRRRVAGESLAESVGLALAGGLLALGVAFAMTRLLAVLWPVEPLLSYPPRIDLPVIGYTLALSLLAGLLFGAGPALGLSRIDPAQGLSGGGVRFSRSRRVFAVLVVTQIALATTLLIGMGLSLRSFVGLLRLDLGVETENVLTLDLVLPRSRYAEDAQKAAFFRELLERIEALPGVESAGMNYALPLSGVDPSNSLGIVGRTFEEHRNPSANLGLVDPGYFETLRIPLLRGRHFLPSDTHETPKVAIVDERLAKKYFPGEDPLGRRITIAGDDELTIVGVVGAVRQEVFEEVARPSVYLPSAQRSYLFTSLAVRAKPESLRTLAATVRSVVRSLDKDVPVSNLSTLLDAYRKALSPQRLSLLLIGLFAALGLFLMQVGTYGSMADLTRRRHQEAGIRMALGAEPKEIFGLVFREGLLLSLLGAGIGLAVAVAAERLLASLVYGLAPFDGLVFGAVTATVLLAAFLAYGPPARSLSRVEPNRCLGLPGT